MIKAKRERGGVWMDGSFTPKQWNSGVPQKAGWKEASTVDLSSEIAEAKTGRENGSANVAMQELLTAKDSEISSLKITNEEFSIVISGLQSELEILRAENVILAANQKGKPGRTAKVVA